MCPKEQRRIESPFENAHSLAEQPRLRPVGRVQPHIIGVCLDPLEVTYGDDDRAVALADEQLLEISLRWLVGQDRWAFGGQGSLVCSALGDTLVGALHGRSQPVCGHW